MQTRTRTLLCGALLLGACGPTFIETAAREPGAQRLPSGIVWKTLRPGNGASPGETDRVRVNYEGRFTDGTVFDTTGGKDPVDLPLDHVIKCWTEGLQHMKVGEKARLVCPSNLAYGQKGAPPTIPPDTTLVFEIELLGINP